ncbi:MAG: TetM/TetW/TetO/TetS family tetracycline resistance ribosomal protection protein [Coriobacteriales bacterium]|nr:TetM/TetW/TetO/TetS family tetracycline resistance ribosomal protection protein [Coriobacteriales bacterium]
MPTDQASATPARHAVVGLLAHVDAGKTTLAEALLYCSGTIRAAGRVDHGDAHLDFDPIERDRGITVFAKQMVIEHDNARLMFLDTPGHVDFCAEAERTLGVLDLAVLVVGANDGVQGHARTLWRLLKRYDVPTIVFVNKMDLAGAQAQTVLDELQRKLDAGCYDHARVTDPQVQEQLATTDDDALEEYLDQGSVSNERVRDLVRTRKAFPVLFGAALRMEGARELLEVLARLALPPQADAPFAARVYKVARDQRGERVAFAKVLGGTLRAKTLLEGVTATGKPWSNKVDQLRIYHANKYEVVGEVPAGWTCAATGLAHVVPGDGLGAAGGRRAPLLEPVLDYKVEPHDCDAHAVYRALCELAEEDPLLGAAWVEELQEVRVRLMGVVQQEVVQRLLLERYGLAVGFGPGSIRYAETIAQPVVGVGHFEPLRHYAEVHLLLEPLPQGSGVVLGTRCSEDDLDRNWQRLILTNAMERPHRGTLVGAPITNMRITLVAGRAHAKHTEGGDFRQATYRAIRQGLMQARSEGQCVLLEPWYAFELEVPAHKVGRALADLQRMGARFLAPQVTGEMALIEGEAPVATMGDYALQVSAYTGGQGRLFVELAGYEPCHDADQVVSEAAYDPRADLPHTPDSVFCSHGAGYTVPWDQVPQHAHVSPDPSRYRPWREADETFFGRV